MSMPLVASPHPQSDIFTLKASSGSEKSFVVGLEWVDNEIQKPGTFEIFTTGRKMKASAFVPHDNLTGFYLGNQTRSVLGLPALASSLLSFINDDKNIIVVLNDTTDPERFLYVEMSDDTILRGWDRVCTRVEALVITQDRQDDVDKVIVSEELQDTFLEAGFDLSKIEFLNIDRLVEKEFGTEPLKLMPFDWAPKNNNSLLGGLGAIILLLAVAGFFFEDYISPLVFASKTITIKTVGNPANKIASFPSPSELLLACHDAYYTMEHMPLGWKMRSVACRSTPQPKSGAIKAGLTKSQIIVQWSLPQKANTSLLRPLAETAFSNWDYGIVLDQTAESRNKLSVKNISLKAGDIPSFLQFRRSLDRFFGIAAKDLRLSKTGDITGFSFTTSVGLDRLSGLSKNVRGMHITSASRNTGSKDINWKIEGQLAHVPAHASGEKSL